MMVRYSKLAFRIGTRSSNVRFRKVIVPENPLTDKVAIHAHPLYIFFFMYANQSMYIFWPIGTVHKKRKPCEKTRTENGMSFFSKSTKYVSSSRILLRIIGCLQSFMVFLWAIIQLRSP